MIGNAWHVPVARLFVLGMLLTCGVTCDAREVSKQVLTSISPSEVDPIDQLWGLEGADFVLKYLDLLPEPLRSIALPYAEVFVPPTGDRVPGVVQALRIPRLGSLPAYAPGTREGRGLGCRLLLAAWVPRQQARLGQVRPFGPRRKRPLRRSSSSRQPPLRRAARPAMRNR
eukprot:10311610-Heterocapsa_arctica.AAC.1